MGLLLLILLLLCLLLFVPIAYSVDGAKHSDRIYAKGKLFVLGSLVRVLFEWDKEKGTDYSIKVLGIELKGLLEGDTGSTKDFNENKKASDSINTEYNKNKADDKAADTSTAAEDAGMAEDSRKSEDTEYSQKAEASEEKTNRKFDETIERIGQIYEDVLTLPQRISDKISRLKSDAEKRAEFFEEKKALLEDERFMAALKAIYEDFKVLLKKIRPEKGKAAVKAGFEDPYYTGCMAAFYSIIYPLIGDMVVLNTDFENTIFEGDFYFKGKFTVFVVLYFVYRVYFKDDFSYIKDKLE